MADTGEITKLKIEAYLDNEYSEKATPFEFVAMFNPTTFNRVLAIEYEDGEAAGNSAVEKKFKAIKPSDFSVELLIDGTGVSGPKIDVSDKIDSFLQVCAAYNGEIHRPHYLKVNWAKLVLKAVLTGVDVAYTLFDNNGAPLRAKINATFSETVADDYRVKEEKNESPDLTHVRTVTEGDTLPLMTKRIYGDSKFYMQVAKANGLKNFRNLRPGDQIYFPPIIK